MVFPQLKHSKIQLDGVKARLMKNVEMLIKQEQIYHLFLDDVESDDLTLIMKRKFDKDDKEEKDDKSDTVEKLH